MQKRSRMSGLLVLFVVAIASPVFASTTTTMDVARREIHTSTGINDRGDIVGAYSLSVAGFSHGFLLTRDGFLFSSTSPALRPQLLPE